MRTSGKPWKLYAAISLISVIFVLLMLNGFGKAILLIREHSTVFDALGNVESEINKADIWYDSVFFNKKNIMLKQAEYHIDKALRYARSLTKEDTINRVVFYPFNEKILIENINNLSIQLENIKAVGKKYFADRKEIAKAEETPAELISLMRVVSKSVGDVRKLVRATSMNELHNFGILRVIIILLFVLFQILLLFSVYVYNKHRKHDFISVQESYAKLQETYADLEIAEGLIKENEKQYKTLVNKSPVGIYELDRKSNFISINEAGIKLRKYSKTDEIIDSSYFDFVSHPDRERIKQLFEDALKGKASEFEYKAVKRNDYQQIISANFIPLLEENGTVNKVMGITQDITDVVTYGKKLEKANILYSILSEINQAIVRTDNIQELYDKVCKIFVEYGKFKLAWIGLIDFPSNSFKPVASYGSSNGYFKNLSFSLNNEKYNHLEVIKKLLNKEIVIFNNIKDDPDYPFWRENALKTGFVSGAAVPITMHDYVIGILSIGSSDLNYFGEQEYNLLNEIGLDISFAIEKINSEIKRRHAEEAIRNIETGISSAVGTQFFDSIVKSLNKTIGAYVTYIGEYNSESDTIKILSVFGDERLKQGTVYELTGTPCKIVISEGKYSVSGNLSPKFANDKLLQEMKIESYFGLRLMDSNNSITGILVSLYTEKIKNENFVGSIYNIFSSRVSAELERKHMFESLQSNEIRFRSVIESALNAIISIDEEGIIIDWNQAAVETFGFEVQEAIGKNVTLIMPDRYREKHNLAFDNAAKYHKLSVLGKDPMEIRGKKKDGTEFPLEMMISLWEMEGKTFFTAIMRDITARKQAIKEIENSEKSYRELFDNSEDAIYLQDRQGKFVMVNQVTVDMYGYTREYFIGKTPEFLSAPGKNDLAAVQVMITKAWDGEPQSFEFWGLRKSGEIFPKTVKLKKGSYLGNDVIIAFAHDISADKKAKTELILAREKAEASDKLKSEFLAQMSHEIRTPINTILSFSSLIKYELEDKVSSDLKESFVGIGNAGRRIIRTIDLILNMSELQANNYDYRPKVINLQLDVFNKLEAEYKQVANEKGITTKFETIEDAYIFADEYTINQIFGNLVDNAVKYTKKGEVKLSCTKKDSFISVNVEDTGIGILEEYLPRLFDAFSQEEQGYTRSFEGNGLGMALVKKYCEMNNAKIEVKSKKGQGTTFTVTFELYRKAYGD